MMQTACGLLDARSVATAAVIALIAALPWLVMHLVATRGLNDYVEEVARKLAAARRLREAEERRRLREVEAEVEPRDVDVRELAESWQQFVWTGNRSADESRPPMRRPARSRRNTTPLEHTALPHPGPERADRARTASPAAGERLSSSSSLPRNGETLLSSSRSLAPGGPTSINAPETCLLEEPCPLNGELRVPADFPRSEREWAAWASAADIVASAPGRTTPFPRRPC